MYLSIVSPLSKKKKRELLWSVSGSGKAGTPAPPLHCHPALSCKSPPLSSLDFHVLCELALSLPAKWLKSFDQPLDSTTSLIHMWSACP